MMKFSKKKIRGDAVQLFLIASCGIVFLAVFAYLPMVGVLLGFKDGNDVLNIFRALIKSDWTFSNFTDLVGDEKFWKVFRNTIGLNLLMLLINFPMPIIFALLIDQVRVSSVRKGIQTVVNFPHFVSWTIMGGIVIAISDVTTGIINPLLQGLGFIGKDTIVDLNMPQYFWGKMIVVSALKGVGWGSIIYSAAISAISPDVYEAATIDGANRFQKAIRITVPMIAPTITVFLLLNISRLLGNSFEQFYIFQTTANLDKSEVLSTYIYKEGFTRRNYSYAAALGFFDSIVSVVLLVTSNFISNKTTGRGIF